MVGISEWASADVEVFVGLQRQPPDGIVEAGLYAFLQQQPVFPGVAAVARLQEMVTGGKRCVAVEVLSGVDKFQLVALCQYGLRTVDKVRLRRHCNPVNASGYGVCAVGFHCDEMALERRGQLVVDKQRRLTTRQHHMACRVGVDGGGDFVGGHHHALVVVSIAERAAQVAPRKAHKHRRSAGVESFALKAVENFVDFICLAHRRRLCRWLCFLPTPVRSPCSIPESGRKSIWQCSQPLG